MRSDIAIANDFLQEAIECLMEGSQLEIHFYDFDNTLFKSPWPPKEWKGKWWSDPQSLEKPFVPTKPTKKWWIMPIVKKAKKSIADKNVYAVLMSGRHDKVFRWRIPELLKQMGLNFDEVVLSGDKESTLVNKKRKLHDLLKRFSHVKRVQIWDDRDHLEKFVSFVEKLGYKATGHKVVG